MKLRTLDNLDLRGKYVLLRDDFNVQILDGKITEGFRIERSMPTIDLLRNAGARVAICSHLGRPKGVRDMKYSLRGVAEYMNLPFVQNAIIVAILISLCSSLLGVTLVLKRFSFIGDGLSHVGFGVLTIATAFGATSPLYIAIPCVAISAIILRKLGNNHRIKSDSCIALISSTSLAETMICSLSAK